MTRRPLGDRVLGGVRGALGGLAESVLADLTTRNLNARGGDLTLRNARVWTGHPLHPWAEGLTIRKGRIVALDADSPTGRVIDLRGALVLPGLHDSHCHPQTAFMLVSPDAPYLFGARSVDEVLDVLRRYTEDYPEDRYPRLFGWMSALFAPGEEPRRELLDRVVGDRPCYLVHHSGHEFWANTAALEAAAVLDRQPEGLPANVIIHRDPATGRATGYLEESEYANTDGVLLRGVRAVSPMPPPYQELALRTILEMYSKVGVTSIWTKDGDLPTTGLYESLLRHDSLPVRAFLDVLYTPLDGPERLADLAARAAEVRCSGLPEGFLRCDGAKIMFDLPCDTHQAWLCEPYADRPGYLGVPIFQVEELRRQVLEADLRGLCVNALAIGDRSVQEALDAIAHAGEVNPPRTRRHTVEHAEFVRPEDRRRFRQLDVVPIVNPIGAYPDESYQEKVASVMGTERIARDFQPWRELLEAGAMVASGSDFPLAPMDPLVGMHILVNGTDLLGRPPGGRWPHKRIPLLDALRCYTVNAAYARGEDLQSGCILPGFQGDVVALSDDILAEGYDPARLPWAKATLTVFHGHVVHEDFSGAPKTIELGDVSVADPRA